MEIEPMPPKLKGQGNRVYKKYRAEKDQLWGGSLKAMKVLHDQGKICSWFALLIGDSLDGCNAQGIFLQEDHTDMVRVTG
jgi:hypothetical protein